MTEKKTSPEQGYRLSSSQAWENLFQQEVPITYRSNGLRKILRDVGDMYANIHLSYSLTMIHWDWLRIKSSEIDAKNIVPISFTPGTIPFGPLDHNLFFDHHPEGIQILDPSLVKKLEGKLIESRILKRQGLLAGEVLFSHHNPLDHTSARAIGLGVINRDTNEPEGIIFVPEDMFPYKKTGLSGKNGRKRIVTPTAMQSQLEPVRDTI